MIKPINLNTVIPQTKTQTMRSNKLIYALALVVLAGSLVFTGCKKRKAAKNEDGQASSDNRSAQGELDGGVSDANSVIQSDGLLNGRQVQSEELQKVMAGPCGNTYNVDTTGRYMGTVTLNYTGVSCWNRTRTGKIRLTILNYSTGTRWKDAGAVLKVEYLSYRVTRTSDSKFVELNGTALVTNNTGGTWLNLFFATQPTLVHSVSASNLYCNFDNDGTAEYNINRKFTYTYSGGIFTAVGEGTGSHNSINNLENYGKTRKGDDFTSEVKTPVIWNTSCGAHAPIQGEVEVKVDNKTFVLNCLFGVDANGNSQTVGVGSCPYGMKVEWSYKKKTYKKVFGYS